MRLKNILCVDDTETCRLYDLLFSGSAQRYKVISAENLEEIVDFVKNDSIDLYILGTYAGEVTGIELCRIIREKDSKTPIVFYSRMSREIDRSLALAAGANAYLVKGTEIDILIEAVDKFLN